MNEYNNTERRSDYLADGKLEQIQKALHEQTIITSRLVTISENQSKVLEAQERWREQHEKDFQQLSKEVYASQMQVSTWVEKLNGVERSLSDLARQVRDLTEAGLKIRGGWITVTIAAGMVMGAITLVTNIVKLMGA